MKLNELYDIADNNNISVYHYELNPVKSMSVPGAIGIDTDCIETTLEEKEHLAHELGHCMLGAFYTVISPYELKSQKEYKANRWATQKLVPFPELLDALKNGIAELWELAEYFEVSEDTIKNAFTLYESKLIELRNNF